MPETTTEARSVPLEDAAPVLALRVEEIQRRTGWVALETGFAMGLPILFAWLAMEMPLDWHFDLPRWARGLFLLAGLGGTAAIWWFFGVRPWLRKPSDEQVALSIERALPQFRSRFIASVQLSTQLEEHRRPLVRALVESTTELAHDLEFSQVVRTEQRTRWAKVSAMICLVAGLLWWWGGKASVPLLKRAWLVNVPKPSNTQITAFTGDRVIALGDDLRLEAMTAGVLPETGQLRVRSPRQPEQAFTLDRDPLNVSGFMRTLQSIQENFTYRVELGDARTRWAEVRVQPRPTVVNLEIEQRWPAYTGFAPERRNPAELKLLAGSKLALRIHPNAALAKAGVQLVGSRETRPISLQAELGTEGQIFPWSGVLDVRENKISGMTFHLTGAEGVESKGMAVYPIQVIPDQPPTLAMLWPERREELVTSRATLVVAFEAKDDYGIDRIKLHYGVNWGEGAKHRTVELDLTEAKPKVVTRRFECNLGRLTPPLKEGDIVDYWFEAIDANDVTGPGATTLPQHYQARVVSEEEKRADLAARLADTLQGLNNVKQGQEDLAHRLGELIYEKRPPN